MNSTLYHDISHLTLEDMHKHVELDRGFASRLDISKYLNNQYTLDDFKALLVSYIVSKTAPSLQFFGGFNDRN